MQALHQLTQHLPSLRRFGRALLDSQAQADDAVHTTLKRIASLHGSFADDEANRVHLYRLYLEAIDGGWTSTIDDDGNGRQLPTDGLEASPRLV